MLGQFFKGFQLVHAVFLAIAAVGFFIFWVRTRLWLPKYVHVLAAIGLAVGVWCASNVPNDAPISKEGPIAKLLLPLTVPAMVYFFFVFYGGQKAAFRRKPKNATQIANLLERFLSGRSLYPREWHDFVTGTQPDIKLDSYRKRCAELTAQLNSSSSAGSQGHNRTEEYRRRASDTLKRCAPLSRKPRIPHPLSDLLNSFVHA